MPVELLPFGFDLDEKLFNECVRQKEILKACFLGNPDSQRASFIVQLAEADIPIDVYGSRWDKQLDHPNITIHSPVYLNDFWKTLRKYRVQLNLMRLHNPDSHNMRSFEIPGVGGIMLAPDTPDHRMFFEEGKELFLYNDVETCIAAINSLLNFSEANANYIREQARAKSLANGYTYKDRSKQALDAIRKIAYVNEERV
jgi:spore maturation protein CgeB